MDAANTTLALDALYATGHWLYTERRYEDAVRVFHAMLCNAPTDERAWLALGACHEDLGNPEVAYTIYHAARRAVKTAIRCDIARARIALTMGLDDESHNAYEAASAAAEDANEPELLEIVTQERRAS